MLHFALRNTDLQLSSSYIFSKYSLCHSRRRAQEFQRLIANTGRENFPCGFLCTLKFHLNFVSTPQSMFNINRPPPNAIHTNIEKNARFWIHFAHLL